MAGMSGAVDASYVDAIERAAFGSGVEPDLSTFAPAGNREESLAGGDGFEQVDSIGNRTPVNGGARPAASGGQDAARSTQPDPREQAFTQREQAIAAAETRIAAMLEKVMGVSAPKPEVKPEPPKGPVYRSLEESLSPKDLQEMDAATLLRIREIDKTHRANFEAVMNAAKPADVSPLEQKIAALEAKIQQDAEARQLDTWRAQAAQAEQVFGQALDPYRTAIAEYVMKNHSDIGTAIRVVCPQIWEAKIAEQAIARAKAQFVQESRAAQLWPGGAGAAPKNLEFEDGESFMDSARKVHARAAQAGQGRVSGPGLY